MKKAVYAGSFDPFTLGHLSIAVEASKIFDELYLVVAVNSQKKRRVPIDAMMLTITEAVRDYGNIKVIAHSGLVADYCNDVGASYLVRGLRNTSDYMYEENIAKINQEINPALRTIYLRAANDVISSSMVWELYGNGKPVGKYLPYPENILGPSAQNTP